MLSFPLIYNTLICLLTNVLCLFQWESGTGKEIEDDSPLWGFKKLPFEDTCVWILQISAYNYTLGNYDCVTNTGFVCEIDLTKLSLPQSKNQGQSQITLP